MADPIPVADRAIAQVALTEVLLLILATEPTTEPSAGSMARKLLTMSTARFQPSTRRLVLSFDLAMTPEDD